jgi:predicted LPLAT superfamily acyltransferase
LWFYRVAGRQIMNGLLRLIVLYFFLFNRSARQASRIFLQRVYQFPGQKVLMHKPGLRDIYRHFYYFSDAIVDRIAAWSGDISVAEIDFPDREKLRSSSRGIVVLTSHLGNADMCRALCEHTNGKKINVLLHTGGAPGMNRLLQSVNPKSQVELISVREVTPATAVLLQEKIEAGEWVVIAADRLPPDNPGRTELAMLLGREAPFPQGAFILAALLQSPVYALFCLKEADHFVIHVDLLAASLPFGRRQRQAVIAGVIKNYAALLEKYCLLAPFQWFNFHDFWQPLVVSKQDKESI